MDFQQTVGFQNCKTMISTKRLKKSHAIFFLLLVIVWLSSALSETVTSQKYGRIIRRIGNRNSSTTQFNTYPVVADRRSNINNVQLSRPHSSLIRRNSGRNNNTVTSISSSVSVAKPLTSKKRETKLPLENLFPNVYKSSFTSTDSPQEALKSAVLNHSVELQDSEKDLDRLVFSQLPQGSKLIVKTVKIVKTDDDGNEQDSGDEMSSWKILSGKTKSNGDKGNASNEDEDDENENNEFPDLMSAASQPTSHYNSHGSNVRNKENTQKYYDEKDHGKQHKHTVTDTEGTKVKNYHGQEKGITDFENTNGKSQKNEGERFKDSKKKNKGRKVTGTYKEDTEGQKVKNEHGTTNSFNKVHHETAKNTERHNHAQNHHKSQSSPVYRGRDSESPNHQKHRHENHNYDGAYSNDKVVVTAVTSRPTSDQLLAQNIKSNLNGNVQSHYSAVPIVTSVTSTSSSSQATSLLPSSPSTSSNTQKRPVMSSSSSMPSSHHQSFQHPKLAMTPPGPPPASSSLVAKPSEMKMFFSPRERYYPYSDTDAKMAYAPNFGPVASPASNTKAPMSQVKLGPISFSYNIETVHPRKPIYKGPSNHMTNQIRYAGEFPVTSKIPSDHSDQVPNTYSTLSKTILQTTGNLISIDKSKSHEVIGSTTTSSSSNLNSISSSTENVIKVTAPNNNPNPSSEHKLRPQFGWVPSGKPYNNIPFNHLRIGKHAPPPPHLIARNPYHPSTISPGSSVILNNHRPSNPGPLPSTSSYNVVRRHPQQFSQYMDSLFSCWIFWNS